METASLNELELGEYCRRKGIFLEQPGAWREACRQANAALPKRTHLRETVGLADLVLHADNGSPMKGATMLATLQRLGVVPSFSRPSVSSDNPYSEAGFATFKGSPADPEQPFESLAHARAWVATFVLWYHKTHRHSALKFVTPGQRHRGEDHALHRAAPHDPRWGVPEDPAAQLLRGQLP